MILPLNLGKKEEYQKFYDNFILGELKIYLYWLEGKKSEKAFQDSIYMENVKIYKKFYKIVLKELMTMNINASVHYNIVNEVH